LQIRQKDITFAKAYFKKIHNAPDYAPIRRKIHQPADRLRLQALNSLFDGEQVVKDVHYRNSEHVGDTYSDRKAIFDVYCENERGEKFIVEMQNAFQQFFKDRSLFYSTFPIREQAPAGSDWNFRLNHVYVVALLNFNMHEEAFSHDDISHDVGLLDKKTHRVFNDKLTFKYVEISKFNKSLDELETLYDKWLYLLRNLSRLEERPAALREKIFTRLFEQAEIAKFSRMELHEYEDSLKTYRDLKNSIDTAILQGHEKGLEEGLEQGRAEGRAEGQKDKAIEIARNLRKAGMSIKEISQMTGLSETDIDINLTAFSQRSVCVANIFCVPLHNT